MFKLALDSHMVLLIEEARTLVPYATPSQIVESALVRYLDFLDSRQGFDDDLKGCGDLLELLCTEFDEGDC